MVQRSDCFAKYLLKYNDLQITYLIEIELQIKMKLNFRIVDLIKNKTVCNLKRMQGLRDLTNQVFLYVFKR